MAIQILAVNLFLNPAIVLELNPPARFGGIALDLGVAGCGLADNLIQRFLCFFLFGQSDNGLCHAGYDGLAVFIFRIDKLFVRGDCLGLVSNRNQSLVCQTGRSAVE